MSTDNNTVTLKEFLGNFNFDYEIHYADLNDKKEMDLRQNYIAAGGMDEKEVFLPCISLRDQMGVNSNDIESILFPVSDIESNMEMVMRIIYTLDSYVNDVIINEFSVALEREGIYAQNMDLETMYHAAKEFGITDLPYKAAECVFNPELVQIPELEAMIYYAKELEFNPDNNFQNTFEIYQLKRIDETWDYRFEPYERLQRHGKCVDYNNYDLVYQDNYGEKDSLDSIYYRFNMEHPEDFRGHSLSVSDVIVLHTEGLDKAFYVDSFGFKEVPEFIESKFQSIETDKELILHPNETLKEMHQIIGQVADAYTGNKFSQVLYELPDEKKLNIFEHYSDEPEMSYYALSLFSSDADKKANLKNNPHGVLASMKCSHDIVSLTKAIYQITGRCNLLEQNHSCIKQETQKDKKLSIEDQLKNAANRTGNGVGNKKIQDISKER